MTSNQQSKNSATEEAPAEIPGGAVQPPDHETEVHHAPSVGDIDYAEYAGRMDEVQRRFLEQAQAPGYWAKVEAKNGESPSTGVIDVAAFVRAQAEFLKVQTWFLLGQKNQEEIVAYSHAQGEFIAAQQEVLRQVGVI